MPVLKYPISAFVDKCDGHVVVISEREGFTILWSMNKPDVIANACAVDKDAQSPMWDVLQQVGITVHQAKDLDEALKLARTLWGGEVLTLPPIGECLVNIGRPAIDNISYVMWLARMQEQPPTTLFAAPADRIAWQDANKSSP